MTNFTNSDLRSLANLLNLGRDLDPEEDDFQYGSLKNPHQIAQELKTSQNNYLNKVVNCSSKSIWDEEEVPDEEDDEANIKDKPEYEMVYQQDVTPDDIFLQLSGKGPGTDSCECLLVKIKLPGIYLKDDVNLNISASKLICKTNKHYLNLDFPKEVDPVKCSARWDQLNNLLVVKIVFDVDVKLRL